MEAVVMPDIIEEAGKCVVDVVGMKWVLEAVVHPKPDEGPGAAREGLAFKDILQALVVGLGEES